MQNINRKLLFEAIISFRDQDPNFDPRDYGHDTDSVGHAEMIEARQGLDSDMGLRGDFKTYKDAKTEAKALSSPKMKLIGILQRLTDDEIMSCFRGRLSLNVSDDGIPKLEYCTGQYFPTEFERALVNVLEELHHAAKLAEVRETGKSVKPLGAKLAMCDIQKLNEDNGGRWFDKSNMRFFGTKLADVVIPVCDGWLFLSRETNPSDQTRWTVRHCDQEGDIDTVGEFHHYMTKADALAAAKAHAASGKLKTMLDG